MGTIGETVSGWWSKLTGKTPEQTAAPITKMLPTGPDMGTPPEPAGYTSAGGRRHRKGKKTMRGGKRHRKTHKARKH